MLTTVALGLSIAVMAFTAFVVMRQQMMSSLDQSLLNRAHKATAYTTLSEITATGAPAWMLGAADVRIIFITAEGRRPSPATTSPTSRSAARSTRSRPASASPRCAPS